MHVPVGVGVVVEVVTVAVVIGVEVVGIQVVIGTIVGFDGAEELRNSVVGNVSLGRNTENTDSGMLAVLNNSVST